MPAQYLELGWSTNTLGNVAQVTANPNKIFGLRMTSSQTFGAQNAPSAFAEFPSWGVQTFTNGNYYFCLGSDQSNLLMSVVWPGHTNEIRGYIPWTSASAGAAMSNFCADLERRCERWIGSDTHLIRRAHQHTDH